MVGLTAGGTAAFYTYTTYMQKFLKLSVGLTDDQTTHGDRRARSSSRMMPAADLWRDLRPHRPQMAADLRSASAACCSPSRCSPRCRRPTAPFAAFLLIAAAWMIVSGYTSINAVVKAELFPTSSPRDRRRPALCAHGVDLRRHRRFGRAVVQVDRPRELVLLLPDRNDRRSRSSSTCSCATPRPTRRCTGTSSLRAATGNPRGLPPPLAGEGGVAAPLAHALVAALSLSLPRTRGRGRRSRRWRNAVISPAIAPYDARLRKIGSPRLLA